jgi:fused signal recognition particle receptor
LKFDETLAGERKEESSMFDFLKKKISGFIDGLTKKEDEKAEKEGPAKAGPEEERPAPEKGGMEPAGMPQKAQPREEKPAPKPAEAEPPEIAREAKAGRKAGEQKPAKAAAPEPKARKPEPAPPAAKPAPAKQAAPVPKPVPEKAPPAKGIAIPWPAPSRPAAAQEKKPEPKATPAPEAPVKSAVEKAAPAQKPETLKPHPGPAALPAEEAKPATEKPEKPPEPPAMPAPKPEAAKPEPEMSPPPPIKAQAREAAPQEERPKERLKLGIVGTVKSLITREVQISEKDVKDMVESLELELLEADVDMAVAEGIKDELLAKLVGSKVGRDRLHSFVSQSIRETLVDILTNERDFDIVERVMGAEKPVKIMFIGINGAGKTTTIAKVAKLLMDNERKVVFAAADTFRAAAIEQMAVHAERLNVKMIKREYGSDPTSVAYDAVNYAKAHGIDAVLIDTAGRQDTNISLLNEMKKMRRVISPDITIYIGESIAGNAILEQISSFNREVGVDAVILSKLDCDPKGGTMLSINKATGVPIIYVGVGQGYDALERFEPEKIVARIVE